MLSPLGQSSATTATMLTPVASMQVHTRAAPLYLPRLCIQKAPRKIRWRTPGGRSCWPGGDTLGDILDLRHTALASHCSSNCIRTLLIPGHWCTCQLLLYECNAASCTAVEAHASAAAVNTGAPADVVVAVPVALATGVLPKRCSMMDRQVCTTLDSS